MGQLTRGVSGEENEAGRIAIQLCKGQNKGMMLFAVYSIIIDEQYWRKRELSLSRYDKMNAQG